MFAKEFYLESDPDEMKRRTLKRYRHINCKLECLYRDTMLGVATETGVLGELVVKDYLTDSFDGNVTFAVRLQKGFDLLCVDNESNQIRVQVKTKKLEPWVLDNKSKSYHYHKLTEKNSDFDLLYTVFVGNTFVWVCNPIVNPKKKKSEKEKFGLIELYGMVFIDKVIQRGKKEWNKFGVEIYNNRIDT